MSEPNANATSENGSREPDLDEFEDGCDDIAGHDPDDDFLYLKYCFEGAASLSDVAAALRSLAADLERRASADWSLASPVDGGYMHLHRNTARREH